MHVDATEAWSVECVLRQNAAVGDDERDVGVLGADPLPEVTGAKLRRLDDRHADLDRADLHGRRGERQASPGGLVGLADHADHVRDRSQGVE